MIALCNDYELIKSVLDNHKPDFINENIRLYLESYGCSYDFQEFFLQKNIESGEITAVVMRYNDQIYVSTSDTCESSEIYSFIAGFSHCYVISDNSLSQQMLGAEKCYVMSRFGENLKEENPGVKLTTDSKVISDLIGEYLPKQERMDYFLNLSHQIRHGKVQVYACDIDNKPVSAVIKSVSSPCIITGVYTSKYFRGNGYAGKILKEVCNSSDCEYILLCEEHNVEFYRKCGFAVVEPCFRFRL